MKEGIHPKYEQTTIRCACGAVIETGSTKKDITVEICSKCHPFYTGQSLSRTRERLRLFRKRFDRQGEKGEEGAESPLFAFDPCRGGRDSLVGRDGGCLFKTLQKSKSIGRFYKVLTTNL